MGYNKYKVHCKILLEIEAENKTKVNEFVKSWEGQVEILRLGGGSLYWDRKVYVLSIENAPNSDPNEGV